MNPGTSRKVLVSFNIVMLLAATQVAANIRLPKILSSNMVLQQGRQNLVWGWANANEHININFAGWRSTAIANSNGQWKAYLPSQNYGGPYTLTFTGNNKIELTNILIGEVWVCSGQSNMELPVTASLNADKEIKDAKFPNIRIFTVPKKLSQLPLDDMENGSWQECSPANIATFTAVGYYFGRELNKKLNIPIGLINSSYGGTLIEAWTSGDSMQNDPDFKEPLRKLLAMDLPKERLEKIARIKSQIGGDIPNTDIGTLNGEAVFAGSDFNDSDWKTIPVPGFWGNNGYPDVSGMAWYRRKFVLNKAEAHNSIKLHLSKIYHGDATWINGNLAGSMDPSNDERTYNVDARLLKEGENTIAIKVTSNNGGAGFNSKPEDIFIETSENKISLAGQWKFKVSQVVMNDITTFRNNNPTMLYNGMINPIINYGIRGVAWYQGESNAQEHRGIQYRRLFPQLINDWRQKWDEGNFPFLFVSIANYGVADTKPAESDWAEVREAQTLALSQPNTGMALAIDLGEADNIHPKNKQEVGHRLTINALNMVYHKKVVYASPMYRVMKISGKQVIVTFSKVGAGLQIKGGNIINGFALAGDDRHFYNAKAILVDSHTVCLQADEVDVPVAIRYAWADNPGELNLYSKQGLPLTPFRTDDWDRQVKNISTTAK